MNSKEVTRRERSEIALILTGWSIAIVVSLLYLYERQQTARERLPVTAPIEHMSSRANPLAGRPVRSQGPSTCPEPLPFAQEDSEPIALKTPLLTPAVSAPSPQQGVAQTSRRPQLLLSAGDYPKAKTERPTPSPEVVTPTEWQEVGAIPPPHPPAAPPCPHHHPHPPGPPPYQGPDGPPQGRGPDGPPPGPPPGLPPGGGGFPPMRVPDGPPPGY